MKLEIRAEEYGRMLFEAMLCEDEKYIPEHWKSIKEKAEPLVRELIELGNQLLSNKYKIIGYKDKDGKSHLSDNERIIKAQIQLWGCELGTLKEGDLFWFVGNLDNEMYVTQDDPAVVDTMGDNRVIISLGYKLIRAKKKEQVLKAPTDFSDRDYVYTTKEYWLSQADKLGI